MFLIMRTDTPDWLINQNVLIIILLSTTYQSLSDVYRTVHFMIEMCIFNSLSDNTTTYLNKF